MGLQDPFLRSGIGREEQGIQLSPCHWPASLSYLGCGLHMYRHIVKIHQTVHSKWVHFTVYNYTSVVKIDTIKS